MAIDVGLEPRWTSFEEYKPFHRLRLEISLDPLSLPTSTPYTPTLTLFNFPLPCVRNALYASDLPGYDKNPLHSRVPSTRTVHTTTTLYQHLTLINPDHHVDPQEQRPGVFFTQ